MAISDEQSPVDDRVNRILAEYEAEKQKGIEDGLKAKEKESRLLASFGSGANDGIAGIIGMPVDAANYVLGGGNPLNSILESEAAQGVYDTVLGQNNPLTNLVRSQPSRGRLVEKPFMGSEWVRDAISTVAPPIVPETAGETIVNSVGQQVGGAVTAGIPGGLVRAGVSNRLPLPLAEESVAARSVRAGELSPWASTASKSLQQLTLRSPSAIAESLVGTSPKKLAAVEAIIAASSGVGGGMARVVAPDSDAAQIAGQLVATLGPVAAYEAVRSVASRMRGAWARYRPSESEMKAQIGEDILRATERNGVDTSFTGEGPIPVDTFERTLAATQDEVSGIPGVNLTLGQATASPEILAKEQALARGTGDFQNEYLLKRKGSHEAINDFLDSVGHIPTDTVSIENTQNAMRKVVDEHAERVARDIRASVPIPVGKEPEEASKDIVKAIKLAKTEGRLQAGRLYDPIPDPIPTKNGGLLREVRDQIENPPEWTEDDDIPKFVRKVYDTAVAPLVEQAGGNQAHLDNLLDNSTMEFGSARNLRTKLLRLKKEAVAAGRDSEAEFVERLIARTEDTMDDVRNSTEFPEAAKQYDVASDFYADYSDRFKRKLIRNLIGKDRFGGNRTEPGTAFGEVFLKKGERGGTRADKLLAAGVRNVDGQWVPNPKVISDVREAVLARIASDTTDVNGRVNIDKLMRWHKDYAPFLDRFPDLRREVSSLERTQTALNNAGLASERALADVQKSSLGRIIDMDPDAAVSTILSGKSAARGLRRTMHLIEGDKDAVQGLRRSVLDRITEASSSAQSGVGDTYDFIHPGKIRGFLKRNRAVLESIYSPEEMADLRKVARAADIVARSDQPALKGSQTQQLKNNIEAPNARLAKEAFRHMWGVLGKGPVGWAGEVGVRWLNKALTGMTEEKMRTLWQEAILDPEVAKVFVAHARGAAPTKTVRQFGSILARLGLGYSDEDKENKPTVTDREVASVRPDTFEPAPPPPPPPAPPPPPPKPPKPIDVSKDLKRGTITPTDVQDLARAGLP